MAHPRAAEARAQSIVRGCASAALAALHSRCDATTYGTADPAWLCMQKRVPILLASIHKSACVIVLCIFIIHSSYNSRSKSLCSRAQGPLHAMLVQAVRSSQRDDIIKVEVMLYFA
jgi:hypothetical protein